MLKENETGKWIGRRLSNDQITLFVCQIKSNTVHESQKHKNIGSLCISTDKWCEERREKTDLSHLKKGRHIFQQFSIIKPLENNSSNRYIILLVTGADRGWKSAVHYAVFPLQAIGNISLCRSAVLLCWLMNEFRGRRTNTDTCWETNCRSLSSEIRQADTGARGRVCSAMNACQTQSVGEAWL